LIDLSNMKLDQDGNVPGLEEQILKLKESRSFLFKGQEKTAYVIAPVREDNPLNQAITEYVNGQRKGAPAGAPGGTE